MVQVDICLFDKTGTLTSDKLVAESLISPSPAADQRSPTGPPVTVKLIGNAKKRGGKGADSESAGSESADLEGLVSGTVGGDGGGIVEVGLAAKVSDISWIAALYIAVSIRFQEKRVAVLPRKGRMVSVVFS